MKISDPILQTKTWLENIVIGLQLCPFASKVYLEDRVGFSVIKFLDNNLLHPTNEIINDILATSTRTTTSLLIVTEGLEDFNEYLDTVYALEAALKADGLDEEIQVASFHPDYTFEGTETDDIENYTNRSPFPIIHFLKVEEVAAAIDSYPDTSSIPEDNKKKLKEIGLAALLRMYHQESIT